MSHKPAQLDEYVETGQVAVSPEETWAGRNSLRKSGGGVPATHAILTRSKRPYRRFPPVLHATTAMAFWALLA
jgi:hypothetical protein